LSGYWKTRWIIIIKLDWDKHSVIVEEYFEINTNMSNTTTTTNAPTGGGGGAHSSHSGSGTGGREKPILDLSPYVGKQVLVKFQGGREIVGTLRGWDQVVNLVLEDAVEQHVKNKQEPRRLATVVCRGIAVSVVCPKDGFEEIPNPFVQGDDS
jgi:U6 snRNA-associated Sm-like protein LSm7